MKRALFRLLTSCLSIVSIAIFAGSVFGQESLPFNYRVEYSDSVNGLSIEDLVQVNDGINDGLYVVGYYFSAGGLERGFVYRYEDSQFFDIPTVLGLSDTEARRTACYGMNVSGIVVGVIRDSANLRRAVFFDLFESGTPQVHVLNEQFVEIPPPSETGPGAYKINSVGDILMDRGGIVVNPFLNVAYQVPGASELDGGKDINDHGTVLLGSQQSGGALRSNIHDPNSAEWFPEANLLADPEINNLNEFCARQDVSSGKPRHRVNQYAVRYGSTQVDWYSDPFEVLATSGINDSGDICGEGIYGQTELYLHYSSGTEIETGPTVDVQSLVTDSFFVSGYLWKFKILNRIELSPTLSAPIICGIISPDGTSDRRIFFLIPEIPPPSESYFSVDTPLSIPDNNPVGVASNIVANDHLITGMTVNVNITHQRPSDLEVFLVGPDDSQVQLFNFSGDSNVAEFNGSSSLGVWTLEVYDTRIKKTGTLNSWSITVDY